VADVFTKETGVKVVITGGPEPTWTKEAEADADILWGTAEEDITALLETYEDFSWDDVTPIYVRRVIIAVKKGNPRHICGFDDVLKSGMRIVVDARCRCGQHLRHRHLGGRGRSRGSSRRHPALPKQHRRLSRIRTRPKS
jgi:accessory colonization factor AcfC